MENSEQEAAKLNWFKSSLSERWYHRVAHQDEGDIDGGQELSEEGCYLWPISGFSLRITGFVNQRGCKQKVEQRFS